MILEFQAFQTYNRISQEVHTVSWSSTVQQSHCLCKVINSLALTFPSGFFVYERENISD